MRLSKNEEKLTLPGTPVLASRPAPAGRPGQGRPSEAGSGATESGFQAAGPGPQAAKHPPESAEPGPEVQPWLAPSELILDIETTGLSAASQLFLAGFIRRTEKGDLLLTQLYVDPHDKEAEKDLLLALREELEGQHLLTYNGLHFDLPFLQKRAAYWKVPFPSLVGQDLYLDLRKKKKFFSFPDLKLESLEQAAGIPRTDQLTGAQVAKNAWLIQENAQVRDRLLLHNREDLVNLLRLRPFLAALQEETCLTVKLDRPYLLEIEEAHIHKDFMVVTLKAPDPVYAHLSSQFGQLDLEGDQGRASLPIHRGQIGGQRLVMAVSPSFAGDLSSHQLKAPLLVLMDEERIYLDNLKSLLQDLAQLLH